VDALAREIAFVDVDGLRLRVSRRGEGRPLVLVMGLGGNIEMWAPFEAALAARGVPTVAYDAPGTGESSPGPRPPLRMAGLARVVLRMLDALGYDEVDVLGVSFGGAVAQELARRGGGRVCRLILCATGCGVGGLPGDPRALAILATPRRYHSPEHFLQVAPVLYGGRIRREPELLGQQALARLGRPPSLQGYAAQLYALAGWTSLPWLHRLRQPTLVLAGDDDPIVPLVNGRILAWRIPDARLVVVPGGGHLFLLEQAEEVAAWVAGFLAEADPRAGPS
jgi:poly(3-hydroxyalkanoate) depolymerase